MLLLVLGGLEAGRLDLPEGRPLLPLLLLLILLLLQNILTIKAKIKLALLPFLLFFFIFSVPNERGGWSATMNYQKKTGLNLYQLCLYNIQRENLVFKKSLCSFGLSKSCKTPLVLVRVLATKSYFLGWDFFFGLGL